MSAPPGPPDIHPHATMDFIPIPEAPQSSLAAASDPFDTPMFNRLIRLIEDQNATSHAQREALEKQNLILEDQRDLIRDMRRALYARHIQITEAVDVMPEIRPKEDAAQGISAEPSRPVLVARDSSQDPHQQPPSPNPLASSVTEAVPTSITESDGFYDQVAEESSKFAATEIVSNTRAEDATEPAPSNSETSKGHVHDAIMILNETMKSIKETLLDHGSKLNVLIRDALKDDQPYDEKPLEDESTCTALFEIAMARTKEQVDEWIKRMDVSLVFIALFSAVLTAFLIPAIQNLFPSSSSQSDSPPALPDISLQNVCILHFLALILAILDAVLSVLGQGSTYRERLLRHLAREALAKRWLRILVEGLHIILLASIGLFMTGLLYQLRNLAGSFDEDAPRLLNTWKVGMCFSSIILGVVAASTIHALFYEVSPFGGPFSNLIVRIAETFWSLCVLAIEWSKNGKFDEWMEARIAASWMSWRTVLLVLLLLTTAPIWVPSLAILWLRVEFDTEDKNKLVGAFMDLIAEASDPRLLERAVGSFSYIEWFDGGQGSVDQLGKTYNRIMATDTSVRVRETLRVRLGEFVPCTSRGLRELGEKLTGEHLQFFFAIHSYPQHFRDSISKDVFKPDNQDLRPLSLLPFEECIARVLCSYHHEGKLGDRRWIFHLAEEHCHNLLLEGNRDDVTRILSHVDRLDLIKSYIQNPGYIESEVVKFIVEDRKDDILRGTNQFVQTIDQSRLGPESLSEIFSVLASPPPTDIDLSPLIDYFSRHPYWLTWDETSDTIIGYLNSFPLSQISHSTAVHRFLKQCVDNGFRDEDGSGYPTSDETRARARDLLAELNSTSSLATGAIASTSIQPESLSRSTTLPLPYDSQHPDPLLLSPSTEFPSPAPAHIDLDTVPLLADTDSAIPMVTLTHLPPMSASSESENEAPMAADSRAAFDHLPALENAHNED
ncbi:hypothetical protein SISNIDRAFT_489876 [Sistotremastrum niveocremeum HHB9708]|uniref:DUF6535 domain-containing protein n=1 Tax=Sistotremastrum niveocremeum HHB9708 TaxID=1314777 RepID=A0A164PE29_9AGAM|nr:hypothetical protein SISNIDRAFT_489876 [Sistotremastrum niveocremeum HHB9708]